MTGLPTSPPPIPDEALAVALAELQAEYLDAMPARLGELRGYLARCPGDEAACEGVRRGGHRIAGTAATIGLAALGEVGRAIERAARAQPWEPGAAARIAEGIALLEDLADLARARRALPPPEDDPRYRALRGDAA